MIWPRGRIRPQLHARRDWMLDQVAVTLAELGERLMAAHGLTAGIAAKADRLVFIDETWVEADRVGAVMPPT